MYVCIKVRAVGSKFGSSHQGRVHFGCDVAPIDLQHVMRDDDAMMVRSADDMMMCHPLLYCSSNRPILMRCGTPSRMSMHGKYY